MRRLATELQAMGHAVSYRLVMELLHAATYSLQANRKTREGPQHPDRDGQFQYLTEQVRRFQRQHRPAISVDAKKKERIGDFTNAGRDWRPKDHPDAVRVHDFLIPAQGKAVPELQQFANRTGLAITVCHFPPGTSKWNKIEHRLVSHIAMNWRGKPLVDLLTIVSLIGETTTTEGLRVRSEVDPGRYPMGVVITDAQMAQLQLEPHAFHGDWTYTSHAARRFLCTRRSRYAENPRVRTTRA